MGAAGAAAGLRTEDLGLVFSINTLEMTTHVHINTT